MTKLEQIKIGDIFGFWEVLGVGERRYYFRCLCRGCNCEFDVYYSGMMLGDTKACRLCGVRLGKPNKGSTTHGMKHTRIYRTWSAMKNRCHNKRHKQYTEYGNRGILVCDEWHKFKNFHKWAIENGYQDNLQIDRIDNDLGYSPENCRWVTHQQNNFNRRSGPKKAEKYSKYKGVFWEKNNKRWRSRIKYNNKNINVGSFTDECGAAKAYNVLAKKLFGEYAYLNKIEGDN